MSAAWLRNRGRRALGCPEIASAPPADVDADVSASPSQNLPNEGSK